MLSYIKLFLYMFTSFYFIDILDVYYLLYFFFFKFFVFSVYCLTYVSSYKFILILFKSLAIFVLVIVIRIVIPRYKIESLTKLGWAYSLIFILENFFFFIIPFFFL